MPRIVAFLRAINVGGRNLVPMKRLREIFEALGFTDVETFIASGNVIFTAPSASLAALEKKIESGLQKALGYDVKTFLRTDAEVAAIARYKPFAPAALKTAAALNVAFLSEPLAAEGRKAVAAFKTDIDDFHVNGREVYWLCRESQSRSKFSNARFEKQLKTSATFRGIRTVGKLAAKHCAKR
jgi:uncharacterized protein (DUF1697 family)